MTGFEELIDALRKGPEGILAEEYHEETEKLSLAKKGVSSFIESLEGKTSNKYPGLKKFFDKGIKTSEKLQAVKEAKICLFFAKIPEGTEHLEDITSAIEDLADYANVKLEEIGTTKKELWKFKKKNRRIVRENKIIELGKRLEEAKTLSKKESVQREIQDIIRYARAENISLKRVETSPKALEAIEREGYMSEAKDNLKRARSSEVVKGTKNYYFELVLENLEKAGKDPEDIGTSEEEIRSCEPGFFQRLFS